MSMRTFPVGRIIARTLEAVLALRISMDALGLYNAGKPDAAVKNAILAVAVVVVVESLMWLMSNYSISRGRYIKELRG